MAKKGQPGDVMDSVFDFIFTESQKPPSKVKPVTVTGLDSADPYVDVATAVLEKPLMYVNNTTEGAIKSASNIDITSFHIDPKDGKVRVDLGSSNIVDVLNNDLTFVDKAFDKLEAARKAGRMTAWGKEIAAFTAAGMATQMGLDAETRDVFLKVGKTDTDPNADYDMNLRSFKLVSQFWEKSDFQNISESSLQAIYGKSKGTEVYNNLQSIHKKYETEMAKPEQQRDFSNVFNEAGANRDMHLFFERFNLAKKEAEARSKAATLDPTSKEAIKLNRQARGYRDAQSTLAIISDSDRYEKQGGIDKYVIQKEAELRTLKDELRNLSGATDQASIQRLRDIRGEIKGIDVQVRNFKIQKSAHSLGMIETQLDSIKQLYEYTVGGGLIPALINGDFFDARKNVAWGLQPRNPDSTITLGYLGKDGKLITTEYKGLLAKSGKNRFEQAYYEGMMDYYYRFTPKGIMENLTTGNGFARQAFRQRQSLIETFKNSDAGKLFADGDFSWDELLAAGGEIPDWLQNDPKFAKLLEYVQNNKEKFAKFSKLVKTADKFNVVKRAKDWLANNSLYKKTIGALAGKVKDGFRNLLLKIAKDNIAKGKIEELFAKELGLRAVSIALKTAIKSALASYTGGISAALGFVIDRAVDIAMQVVVKAAKPVIKFAITGFVFALVGIIGILSLIFVSPLKTSRTLGSYSHVAPHEIILGETDYTVVAEGEGSFPGGPLEPWSGGPALPDGEHCLLGSSTKYNCTQGPNDSFSHGSLPNAIDVGMHDWDGTFRAPQFCGKGGGTCTIEFYKPYACMGNPMGGGMQVLLKAEYKGTLYEFLLVHVILEPKLQAGSTVNGGEPVAVAQIESPPPPACWFGRHLHLETTVGGQKVDPCQVLSGDPSSGGFGCSLDSCSLGFDPGSSCAK